MDVKKIAQETHEKNIKTRQDGGAGSGPRKGGAGKHTKIVKQGKGETAEYRLSTPSGSSLHHMSFSSKKEAKKFISK